MTESSTSDGDDLQYRRLTVANIREEANAAFLEVAFLESARFYRLYKGQDNFSESLEALQRALQSNESVAIVLQVPDGDVILKAKTE